MRVWGLRRRIVVNVNGEDRLRLAAIVANRNSPQKHVWRVRIILLTGGTGRRLKRGVFRSIVHLQAAINRPLMNSLLGERASSLRSTGKNEGVKFGLTKNPADLSECEERDQGDTHDDRDGCKSPNRSSANIWHALDRGLPMQHCNDNFFCDVGAYEQNSECQRFIYNWICQRLFPESIGEMQSFRHENYFG